ncbi:conserved hypothetical protein [Trichinella spiralis]|uniref:hypothetical protein n=1 Tax=Trichinella spiralis TaxID=6334 RepID=UPI0001EFD4CD|nr:conserved hypothetical protein [Trichinella spiralis]
MYASAERKINSVSVAVFGVDMIDLSDGSKQERGVHVGFYFSSPNNELKHAIVKAEINETNITALIDTGSSLSFIDERLCKTLQKKVFPADGKVLMASTSFQ